MSDIATDWVRLYFEKQLTAFAKELGKECGTREKEQHEEMQAYVDEQTAALRKTVEEQARIIEAQGERIKSIEAMFAQPGPVVDGVARRLS